MNKALPVVYLIGHGETAWTLTGQYMGSKDLPLIERGERNALRLKERLRGHTFLKVFRGPLPCVLKTCELAGFGAIAETDGDLADWNYGQYEGRQTAEILKERPDWDLFLDGCPGGESPAQVAARADRILGRLRSIEGNVLVFSSLHFMRVLATRWVGWETPAAAGRLLLSVGSLSAVGYDGSYHHPVIRLWNDVHHVGG